MLPEEEFRRAVKKWMVFRSPCIGFASPRTTRGSARLRPTREVFPSRRHHTMIPHLNPQDLLRSVPERQVSQTTPHRKQSVRSWWMSFYLIVAIRNLRLHFITAGYTPSRDAAPSPGRGFFPSRPACRHVDFSSLCSTVSPTDSRLL